MSVKSRRVSSSRMKGLEMSFFPERIRRLSNVVTVEPGKSGYWSGLPP